jgi:hypothetical protein
MKLTNGGITIDVGKADVDFYLRHGYKKIVEPVAVPAPGIAQELPPEKAAEPEKVAEPVKKAKKVVKHD